MPAHEGKVCLVTGSAQGIGLGIARQLGGGGGTLVLADVQADKVEDAAETLRQAGYPASAVAGDVGKAGDVAEMVAKTLERHGRIDVLVNTAGGSGHVALPTIEDIDPDTWDAVINANLRGTYLFARAVVPQMKARKSGSIVNFSSIASRGFSGSVGTIGARLPYAAAKGGIESFTRQLAHDLFPFRVNVNAISPGMVMTEPGARMNDRFALLSEEQQRQISAAFNDDFAAPDDVGALVSYLTSRAGRHVTGQCVPIGMVG
jgi:NAD(P)-dependent dehydrogenase (short-subunit alcohol dehydrogenase family)